MTNILIPMAGLGSRFSDAGYKLQKPIIPVTDRRTGKKVPMVVAATYDLPANDKNNIIYVDRIIHKEAEQEIKKYFPQSKFITIDYVTEGQASTCLLAKDYINNDEELLIGACDNGMVIDIDAFNKVKEQADAIIFTFRKNDAVNSKPQAYGWVKVDSNDNVEKVSVKVPISNNPIKDHAIVGSFWFKKGKDFVEAAKAMIKANDRVNGEFYADQVMNYTKNMGLKVKVFEVDKYICWGTPTDYENYEKTLAYWQEFYQDEML